MPDLGRDIRDPVSGELLGQRSCDFLDFALQRQPSEMNRFSEFLPH